MYKIFSNKANSPLKKPQRKGSFKQQKLKPFIRQKRPSKPEEREGRQVNEGKSRVKGSEEIPNVNEESIRFLSGLWLMKRKPQYTSHQLAHSFNFPDIFNHIHIIIPVVQ